MCLVNYIRTLYRGHGHLQGHVFPREFEVFAGFSGHGNSIYNIIPQLKKENVSLFSCSWGYNNYADACFQSSQEVSSGPVVPYIPHKCLSDFLVMVIQLTNNYVILNRIILVNWHYLKPFNYVQTNRIWLI